MQHNKMLDTLPPEYRADPWVRALIGASQRGLDILLAQARQVAANLLLDSMDEAQLQIEERLCGIVPPEGADIADRKAAISAHWRTATPPTLNAIRAICAGWQNGAVDARYLEGRIKIKFTNLYGVPKNLDSLKNAINAICPAHIPIDYIFTYKTWADYADKTWAEMAEMTWAEAATGGAGN